MTPILFIIGLISILGQVVLLRELSVASFGVELVYILALGFWLAATAMGAVAGAMARPARAGQLAIPLLALATLLPLGVAFARGSRILLGGVPGAWLPFGEQMAILLITLLPSGFLTGWLFRGAAGLFVSEGRTLAAAYAIESAGGLFGGGLSTLGLHWGLQNFTLAVIGALVSAAAPLLIRADGRRQWTGRAPALAVCAILLLTLSQAPGLDVQMTRWNHPSLRESADSPYGRVSVSGREGQVSVFVNDALAFETEGTEAEHFTHLAALQHPKPSRILILGGGLEGTAAEALKHSPAAVDCVELDPAMVGMVKHHLSPERLVPLGEPGVRLITGDPRRFLQTAGRYDLILIGMPEPSSGQSNRFYTLEFFSLCRDRLNPGGVLALRIPASENRWTPQMTERALSIHGALSPVFGHILVLPGDTDVVTASSSALPRDPQVFIERLRARQIRSRLISEPYIRYLLTNDRFAEVEQTLRTRTAPANTDARPICFQLTVWLWLSKFFPALAGMSFEQIESMAGAHWLWAAVPLALLAGLFLLARLRPAWQRILLVAVAGFAGMVFETVLILQYQTRHGVLFRDLGVLITAFMAGLTAGSLLLAAAARGRSRYREFGRKWGAGLIGGFLLLGTLIVVQVRWDRFTGLAETAGLLAAAGFLVAGLFAYASLRGVRDQERAISPLYAADLLGGCAGSVAASLVLVPLAGMDLTAAATAVLAFFALILI